MQKYGRKLGQKWKDNRAQPSKLSTHYGNLSGFHIYDHYGDAKVVGIITLLMNLNEEGRYGTQMNEGPTLDF